MASFYIPTGTIDQHLDGATPELISTYREIDKRVLAISKEIKEPYATGASICYRISGSDVRFIELQLQKKKNILRFFLRTKKGKLNDPKHMIKEAVPENHRWGAGVIIWLRSEDLQKNKFSVDDILDLITQSYNSCR